MGSLFLSLVLVTAAAPAAPPADTVVVCAPEFLTELKPWLMHRQQQGHVFSHITNQLTAQQIRAAIRAEAKRGKLRHVVIVGDTVPRGRRKVTPEDRQWLVPTHYVDAKVNVLWGSEREIATDNWFADLDDDRVPDLTIGRLTADTREEVAQLVQKILRYEASSHEGAWQNKIHCIAGVGGFGQVADSVLEMTTKKFLVEQVPAAYSTTMTYGSWRSPYCPDPRQFHTTTLSKLNEGCLFWVYIGHGQKTFLDRVHVPGQSYHILDAQDMGKVGCRDGLPIALFLACYAGAYDHFYDCLAEEMLRRDRGPIAVLAGSRVTMPYAMSVMSHGLMQAYFAERCETIGEVLLTAKRQLAEDRKIPRGEATQAEKQDLRLMLDALAATISPRPDLMDEERREHLDIFNLLGDPLLRLPQPKDFTLEMANEIQAGQVLELSGHCELAGKCTIELVSRRDRSRTNPRGRTKFDSASASLADYNEQYVLANDPLWKRVEMDFAGGEFKASITVPSEARGPCHVRVRVQGQQAFALGSADLFIRRPNSSERTAAKP